MPVSYKGVPTRHLGNFTTAKLPTKAKMPTLGDGDLAFDTTTSETKQFVGSVWVVVGDGGGVMSPAAAQSDSTAADVEGLVDDFNDLLAKLRAAGLMAT